MRDVVFLLVVGGFFALAAGYVRACSAIAGPEPAVETTAAEGEDGAVAA